VTPAECAYLAGLIDGEGSVMAYYSASDRPRAGGRIHRQGWVQVKVDICNTDERLIDWVAERWAGHVSQVDRSHLSQRTIHRIVASAGDAAAMLDDARPYLVIKGEQADLVLELVRTRRNPGRAGYTAEERAHRIALADRVQALNRKGTRPRGRTRPAA